MILRDVPRRRDFFWAVTCRYDVRGLEVLGSSVDVLVSAGILWRGRKFSRPNWLRRKYINRVFLDSGAQQFCTKFKDYPFTIRQYVDLVKSLKPTYAATLDYPLDITVVYHKADRRDHIHRTVENAVRLLDYDLPNLVLVIQGLEKYDFNYCLDLYQDYGLLDWKYWGIGSLCMAKNIDLMVQVCRLVRRRLGNDKWIHVFGPSVLSWSRIRPYVDSIDTSTWQRIRANRNPLPPVLSDPFKDLRKLERRKACAKWFYKNYVKRWVGDER